MVLSGPPTSLGGSQNVSFSSRNTYRAGHPQLGGGMNVLGNMSSFMGGEGQAFGNGGSLVNMQQGSIDSGAELDRLGNNGFSYDGDNSPCSSGQFQGQPLAMPEPPSSQHMEQQSFQQQFSLPPKTQGKQQFEMVKLEQQMINEQLGPTNPQERFQSIKNLAHHVKSDAQPMHLQQQQQQQFLQQQLRMFQIQQWQQQQQQLVKGAQPRGQLVQQQNSPVRSPVKSGYEPGMCASRVTMYMFHQQQRPDDNNIDFWRKFVNEYYAPNARKKWCVSMYGNGRQPSGVFPQDIWHCDICNRNPGRGFEATFEVLPRLLKIKYDSGTLEELLYIDMPREYQNSSGQIVLDYAKAIQESVFEQLRVVREGQLRILFSAADLKICSWEFCARRHEELIPRRLLIPQISQLGVAAQKYQTTAQNASPTVSELQNNCNMFLSSARQLAKALEVPLVNDLGYTKRYVRCLQISEVVNCMKDLMDYSRDTGAGPIESLAKFSRRSSGGQSRQPEEQSEQQSEQQPPTATAQNMPPSVHSSNGVGPASTTSSTIAALIQQNSMNSRHHQSSSVSTARNPYGLTFQSPPPHSSPTEISMSENQSSQSSSSSFAVQKILQEMMSRQLSSSVHGSAMRVGLGQSQTAIANGPGLRAAGAARVGMGMGAVVSERSMSLRQQQELSNQMLIGGFNNHLQHDWRFP